MTDLKTLAQNELARRMAEMPLADLMALAGQGHTAKTPAPKASKQLELPKALEPSGRLRRRSADELEELKGLIVEAVGAHQGTEGVWSEAIREVLGIEAKELARPLAEAVAEKKLVSEGQRRGTKYSLPVKPKHGPGNPMKRPANAIPVKRRKKA